jgi:GNAT superfamily N-acetyltransferase
MTFSRWRRSELLQWGRHLYVDDLVTVPTERSNGFGSALLTWLKRYGKDAGCSQFHLDSAAHRKDTHRFYEREGLVPASLHFRCDL